MSPSAPLLRSLYRWQLDALIAWLRCGRRGVVEAVTGSGKTDLALAAVADAHRRGLFVLIVVPSRVLMEQWHQRLSEAMPDVRIGRLGDGSHDRVLHSDILVTTRHSAASKRPLPPTDAGGLLVADECHGFGGGVLRKSLMPQYQERLGLTATLERSDDGVDKVLLPYFGGVCYRYGFAEAIADGVCAQPRVAFVSVPLTERERADYVATERRLVAARRALRQIPGMPHRPFAAFLDAVQYLAEKDAGPNGKAANDYLEAFGVRREIVAASSAKYEVLGRFAESIADADGALVFTETVRAANHVINRLDPHVSVEILTGETPRRDRERVLTALRDGRLDAVAAPRVLDEGVDVPDANLGVVVSASRTRRQMIQRMGRILRRKRLGRGARFAIIFASDTMEDPRLTEDRDGFMEEIEDIAEASRVFGVDDFGQLAAFLDYAGPSEPVEPTFIGPLTSSPAMATVGTRPTGLLDLPARLAKSDPVAWSIVASPTVLDASYFESLVSEVGAEVFYAHVYFLSWEGGPALEKWAETIELPSPETADYLETEAPELPELAKPRSTRPKHRYSTGEQPLALSEVADGWILRCAGCGAHTDATPFRWQALERTVECECHT